MKNTIGNIFLSVLYGILYYRPTHGATGGQLKNVWFSEFLEEN